MKNFKSLITGHLDIFVSQNEDEFEGKTEYWNEVFRPSSQNPSVHS
jgi:hypothetical protein